MQQSALEDYATGLLARRAQESVISAVIQPLSGATQAVQLVQPLPGLPATAAQGSGRYAPSLGHRAVIVPPLQERRGQKLRRWPKQPAVLPLCLRYIRLCKSLYPLQGAEEAQACYCGHTWAEAAIQHKVHARGRGQQHAGRAVVPLGSCCISGCQSMRELHSLHAQMTWPLHAPLQPPELLSCSPMTAELPAEANRRSCPAQCLLILTQ